MIHPLLEQAIADLEAALPDTVGVDDVADWHDTAQMLRGYAKRLNDAAAILGQLLFEALPAGTKTDPVASDGRLFRRTGTPTRKQWRTDELLRAVLDSRRFEKGTGALVDETPTEKILHVWALGAPRVTALRERGLDEDEFCVTEWSKRDVAEVTA